MKQIIFSILLSSICFTGGPYAETLNKTVNDQHSKWDGLFLGIKVGNSNTTSHVKNEFIEYGAPLLLLFPEDWVEISNNSSGDFNKNLISGGLSLGYNWVHDSLLYGLEADISSLHFSSSRSLLVDYPNIGGGVIVSDRIKSNYQASIRGRLGIIKDEFLFYLTGGIAIANLIHSHDFSEFGYEPFNYDDNGGASEESKIFGWIIGVGSEWRVHQNWSLFAEYLSSNFPSVESSTQWYDPETDSYFSESRVNHSANLNNNMLRVGINYKF